MTKENFEMTKKISKVLLEEFRKSYNVTWTDVTWEDLLKPFYSGLAARLFIHMKIDNLEIPSSVKDQGNFWIHHYKPEGKLESFTTLVQELDSSKRKAQLLN